MEQSLQFGKIIDQKVGRNVFEGLGRIPIGDAACLHSCVFPCEYVDGRIADHPGTFTMPLGIGQDLEYADRIGLLMIEAVAAIDRSEMLVDAKTVEHRAAEVSGLVGQDSELTV